MRNPLAHPNWTGIGVIVGVIVAMAIAVGTIIYTNKQNEANIRQSKANIRYSYFSYPVSVPIIGGGEIYSHGGVWLVINNDGPSVGKSVLVYILSKVPLLCNAVDQKDQFLVRLQPPQKSPQPHIPAIYTTKIFIMGTLHLLS